MKLAVIGAGAMGGSLAAHAARAGHQVTVVDVADPVVKKIRADGISVRTPEGDFTERVAITSDPTEPGVQDVIVVFVKAQHTDSVARSLAPLVGPDTAVATLQNGWGNADQLAAHLPEHQLVVGVTYNSCTTQGPGKVTHSGRGITHVGGYAAGADGGHGPAIKVAAALTGSGWQAQVSPQVRKEIWKKLVLNCATLPAAALTRLSAGAMGTPGELLKLIDDLAAEAVAVANAQNLDLDLEERMAAIHQVLANAGDGKPSMLQDVLGSRKTEIETVNQAVVAAGQRVGVPVPLNRAMVALVHGLERSYL